MSTLSPPPPAPRAEWAEEEEEDGGVLQVEEQCCCCYCLVSVLSGLPPPSGSAQTLPAPSWGFLDSGTTVMACCGGPIQLLRLADTAPPPHGAPSAGEPGLTRPAADSEPDQAAPGSLTPAQAARRRRRGRRLKWKKRLSG